MKLLDVICFSLGVYVSVSIAGLRKHFKAKKTCRQENLSYIQYLKKYNSNNILLKLDKTGFLYRIFLNTVYAHAYVYIRSFLILICISLVLLIVIAQVSGYGEIFNV